MERFEPRHEGTFLAYLRQILLNAMRDQGPAPARNSIGIALVTGMIIGTAFTLFVVPAIHTLIALGGVEHEEVDAGCGA